MRWRRIEQEYGESVDVDWRAFLLRPQPLESGRRDLEKFREYTQSWRRPASEPDSGDFRVWEGDGAPPTHSVPAHTVAKAAARLGRDAFERIHERLLRAYFSENRDISDDAVLAVCWAEAELPADAFDAREDPEILQQIVAEHEEAVACGATGVPAARLVGNDAVITGAHPLEVFRHWVDRTLARRDAGG